MQTVKPKWTKASIIHLLRTKDEAVDHAMVALYHRQTYDEKQETTTKHTNHMGFSAAHASLGSYYARWVLRKNLLTGRHLEKAREMAIYYAGQLAEIANSKP